MISQRSAGKESEPRWYGAGGVLFAALLASVCSLPLFTLGGGWYRTHEATRYLELAHHFRAAVDAGFWYPRWLPDMYGGYGYPTFVFYQPGFFFANLPFGSLIADPLQAIVATIWFFFFVGGCGAFVLARALTSSVWFGLFGTLLFLFTPFVECNVYVRGDLSEFAAMMLTPWPLFFLLQIIRGRDRSADVGLPVWIGLIISLAAIVVTHPFTALFFFGVFCVLALVCRPSGLPARSYLIPVGLAVFSALVLSSPYWLTAWRLKSQVDFTGATGGWYHPTRHLFNLKPLFNAEWRYGASPWGMPLHLGLVQLLMAVAGGILGRRLPLVKASLWLYLALVVAMTYVAYPLWKFIPPLAFVQFPWRLLSVIAVLQVVCACGLVGGKRFVRPAMSGALLIALALTVTFSARNQFQYREKIAITSERIAAGAQAPFHEFQHHTAANDFLPRTVRSEPPQPRRDETMVQALSGGQVTLEARPGHSPHRIEVDYRTGAEPARVVIDQLGFAGMVVTVTPGGRVDPDLLDDGRMTVALPADSEGVIEAYYGGPPGWRLNLAGVLLWFGVLAGVEIYRRKGGAS